MRNAGTGGLPDIFVNTRNAGMYGATLYDRVRMIRFAPSLFIGRLPKSINVELGNG
jgi:hypothetical protein